MALDWHSLQDAVRAWVKTGTGLQWVVWARQNSPQPPRPYATLTVLSGLQKMGALDEENDVFNGANPAGQEIEQTIKAQREFVVSVQVFSDTTADSGTAYDYLNKALLALALPSVQSALSSAGLAVVNEGAIQDLSALLETKWQGRAAMDVRFRVVDSAVEKTGYISSVTPSGSWN